MGRLPQQVSQRHPRDHSQQSGLEEFGRKPARAWAVAFFPNDPYCGAWGASLAEPGASGVCIAQDSVMGDQNHPDFQFPQEERCFGSHNQISQSREGQESPRPGT